VNAYWWCIRPILFAFECRNDSPSDFKALLHAGSLAGGSAHSRGGIHLWPRTPIQTIRLGPSLVQVLTALVDAGSGKPAFFYLENPPVVGMILVIASGRWWSGPYRAKLSPPLGKDADQWRKKRDEWLN
jgi:peptidoglycan/LPS O-acetylase OafA/YrhL